MAILTSTSYESDSGDIHKITLSDERTTVAGTAPTGAINSDIKVKVSKGNKEFGIRPRMVQLSRVVGTGEDAARLYSNLPVLTPADFDSAAFAIGAEITIGGVIWTIISKSPEDY